MKSFLSSHAFRPSRMDTSPDLGMPLSYTGAGPTATAGTDFALRTPGFAFET